MEVVMMSLLSKCASTSWHVSISKDPQSQEEGHQEEAEEVVIKNGKIETLLQGMFFQKSTNFIFKNWSYGPIFP